MQIVNKKAKFNYFLQDKYEAGIALIGAEVKAIRAGSADLSGSYAKIIDNEIYLVNANISVPGKKNYDPTRTRKLLLKRDQIDSIQARIKGKSLTLVPTKLYTKGRLIKVEVAIAKPKRKFEKKEALKKRDLQRDLERELRADKEKFNDLNRT